MTQRADDYRPPAYLMTMPLRTLRAPAVVIERWCRTHGKQRPTLLHLDLARRARRNERQQ